MTKSRKQVQESILNKLKTFGTIQEAVVIKKEDKIKIMKPISNGSLYTREIWFVGSEPTTLSKDNPRLYYRLFKLKKDGQPASFLTPGNFVVVRKEDLEKWVEDGSVKILGQDEDFKVGEIDVKTIKDILKDAGIDKLTGMTAAKMITGRGSHLMVDLGTDKSLIPLVLTKVQNALKANSISLDLKDYKEGDRYIWIKKLQV
jgi:hypothetical protein